MKLKKVTVTFDYVMVVQDDQSDSKDYDSALDTVTDAFHDMSTMDMDITIVDYNKTDTSFGWTGDCIPYGGDGNTQTQDYEN